jgi:hypothetical protein
MDENRNADERADQAPDNYPQSPRQEDAKRGGSFGLGSCLLVIAGMVVLFLAVMPIGSTQPATRSAQAETQRREQLIEQAMRDAQAAEQAAVGEPELAASDRDSHDTVADDRAP